MGCKCANAEEEAEEIKKQNMQGTNEENEYNKDYNQDLLGLNNQDNIYQEDPNHQVKNEQNDYNKNELYDNNINNEDPHAKYSDYPEKIVELINNIREDPSGYADVIEDSIKNIIEEEDKENPANVRLFYKKS